MQFSFHIDIRIGAGAFVCGEETALLRSVMGRRGRPKPHPPYPSEKGLWDKPTVINNVETYANIAPIVHNGSGPAAIGTQKSPGTKVFALAGRSNRTGLIEVPMGIPLRKVILRYRRRYSRRFGIQSRANRRSLPAAVSQRNT